MHAQCTRNQRTTPWTNPPFPPCPVNSPPPTPTRNSNSPPTPASPHPNHQHSPDPNPQNLFLSFPLKFTFHKQQTLLLSHHLLTSPAPTSPSYPTLSNCPAFNHAVNSSSITGSYISILSCHDGSAPSADRSAPTTARVMYPKRETCWVVGLARREVSVSSVTERSGAPVVGEPPGEKISPGEEGGVEAKGSESESGISMMEVGLRGEGLRRRGVVGSGLEGDLGGFVVVARKRLVGGGEASFLGRPRGRFVACGDDSRSASLGEGDFLRPRLGATAGATASFLGRPRGRFSGCGDGSHSASLTEGDFLRPRFGVAAGSTASGSVDATEFFLGLPRGRFSTAGASLSASLTDAAFLPRRLAGAASVAVAAEFFLGRPFAGERAAACGADVVDIVACAVLAPNPVLC